MKSKLSGLPGVKNISDDIIISGRTEDEVISRTKAALQRLRTKNLMVNPKKCSFLQTELLYMISSKNEEGFVTFSIFQL